MQPQPAKPEPAAPQGAAAPAAAPPPAVLELVERFRRNLDDYRDPDYKKARVRQEFLDPFFEALGWDMRNLAGDAEAYKDVVHEDTVKIGGATKAPDYSFRVGGRRMFFVEAKKPAVDVQGAAEPAYQLRRYAYSAGLPLSILTDFEELSVYDCRLKPRPGDKASVARVMQLRFEDYPARWAEVAAIFSKDAVLKGSFDRYAEGAKGKRGTTTVGEDFLQEIEGWRSVLAHNLALRNPLDVRQLNTAVQLTIDRIIFLRMAEDRGVEIYGTLLALANGPDIYKRLVTLFERADDKYNSGLFHFRVESDRTPPDELTPGLALDDKALAPILKNLYYPQCPYEFSVLGADILGQVYEQFLGKVIRLTPGGQARVEEKPEVKKAGGVYYTPAPIVRYIVENTVGRELADAAPPHVRLRILDPACGSGSFLIGAYQYLLDWYLGRYVQAGPEKFARQLHKTPSGQWRLTIQEKKRILLDHIFGVDIDGQAVEVTKLSLLLKVLEGENQESLQRQKELFRRERALPDLAANIRCGNSLIGKDFLQCRQFSLFDNGDLDRVNIFDWPDVFPQILGPDFAENRWGFDVVIGNPPYVRIQTLRESAPLEVDYYKKAYRTAANGNYDIYVVFVEKGLSLLSPKGRLGFILPHKFFNAKYGEPLRQLISEGRHLERVVHFGDQQVFEGATTYTCLLFLGRSENRKCRFIKVSDLAAWLADGKSQEARIPAGAIGATSWNFAVGDGARVFDKLSRMPVKLGDVAERMAQGIRTSANEVYVLEHVSTKARSVCAFSEQLQTNVTLDRKTTVPFLQGRDIKRYSLASPSKVVILPYRIVRGSACLIPEDVLQAKHPRTYEYLAANKAFLRQRERGRMRGKDWYAFVYPKNIEVMVSPKILVPDIADRASFALDEQGEFAFTSGYAITLKKERPEDARYILGLLNSRLLDFYLKRVSTTMRGGFFRYFTQFIAQLPIREIDFSDRTDKARHDKMVALVDRMLELQRCIPGKEGHDRTVLQRIIDATESDIDALVYELYGLTKAEIALVEDTVRR